MAIKPTKTTVTVQLNLQQYQVVEEVRKLGTMGAQDGEVIRRAFLKWRQQVPKESKRSRAGRSKKSK